MRWLGRKTKMPVPINIFQSPLRTWWRHQMDTFSAFLAICAGNSPVPGEFPTQRPVTRSFDVYFDQRPNKRLSKQSWGWWFKTPSRPFWRHRNVSVRLPCVTAAFQMLRPCKQKPITEIFICLLSRSVAEQADTTKYIAALYLSLYLVCFVILFILQCSVAARMSNVSHLYLMLITVIMASAEKITPIPGIYAPAPI